MTILLALLIAGTAWTQNVSEMEQRLRTAGTTLEKQDLNFQLAKTLAPSDPKKATVYAEQAVALALKLSDKEREAESAWLAADLAERTDRLNVAVTLYTQAKAAASTIGLLDMPLQASEKLQSITARQGNYAAAYHWQQDYARLLEEKYRNQTNELNRQHAAALSAWAMEKDREAYILFAVLAGIAILLMIFFYYRQRANRRIRGEMAEKNAMIEEKRRRSEQLLLNILPQAVAAELTVRNRVAARRYERTTVMFIDFVSFTHIAERLSPEELVAELDQCFSAFDELISRKRIEKIKTVGDAYICASGLSDRNESPAEIIRTALQIQNYLQKLREKRLAENKPSFEARIGIHFGPVVAGVVGTKKFAYDIWGDTVNTAARMEEACEANAVNVSGTAREVVLDEFQWQFRGKIAAKNKGELDMYYVLTK